MKFNISKVRVNNELFLNKFHYLEKLKKNYILNQNLSILLEISKKDYESLSIIVDKRKFNKNKFKDLSNKVKEVLIFKRNIKFLNTDELEIINSFIDKIFIPYNMFDKNSVIYDFIKEQKRIQDIITMSNYEAINKIVNENIQNKLIQQNYEELYLNMYEELINSIYRFDTSKNLKFITFFTNRMKSTLSSFFHNAIKEYNLTQIVDYSTPRYKQNEIKDNLDYILNNLEYFNILDYLNISLFDMYDKKSTIRELTIIFNAIIGNSIKLELISKNHEIENIRDIIIKEFKINFPSEFSKIQNYSTSKLIQARIILDIVFFNINIEDITLSEFTDISKIHEASSEKCITEIDREVLLEEIMSTSKKYFLNNLNKYKTRLSKQDTEDQKIINILKNKDIITENDLNSFSLKEINELVEIFNGNESVLNKDTKKFFQEVFLDNEFYKNLII